jgi:hypothetical protein
MSTAPIYLDSKLVPASLRCGYTGKKFKAHVCETVRVPADAGLWSGGSREVFTMLRIGDGASLPLPGRDAAPWGDARRVEDAPPARCERVIALTPGIAVVCHSYFCGNDMGLVFYLHPQDAAPMLPACMDELTDDERHVLASMGFKSSYNGKDRFQLQRDQTNPPWSPKAEHKPFPTREAWAVAVASLKTRGFLTQQGGITPAGRNARNACV